MHTDLTAEGKLPPYKSINDIDLINKICANKHTNDDITSWYETMFKFMGKKYD